MIQLLVDLVALDIMPSLGADFSYPYFLIQSSKNIYENFCVQEMEDNSGGLIHCYGLSTIHNYIMHSN